MEEALPPARETDRRRPLLVVVVAAFALVVPLFLDLGGSVAVTNRQDDSSNEVDAVAPFAVVERLIVRARLALGGLEETVVSRVLMFVQFKSAEELAASTLGMV